MFGWAWSWEAISDRTTPLAMSEHEVANLVSEQVEHCWNAAISASSATCRMALLGTLTHSVFAVPPESAIIQSAASVVAVCSRTGPSMFEYTSFDLSPGTSVP